MRIKPYMCVCVLYALKEKCVTSRRNRYIFVSCCIDLLPIRKYLTAWKMCVKCFNSRWTIQNTFLFWEKKVEYHKRWNSHRAELNSGDQKSESMIFYVHWETRIALKPQNFMFVIALFAFGQAQLSLTIYKYTKLFSGCIFTYQNDLAWHQTGCFTDKLYHRDLSSVN